MTLNLFQLLSLAPSGLWRRLIFTPETERVKNISSFQTSTRKKNITRNANRDRKKYFFSFCSVIVPVALVPTSLIFICEKRGAAVVPLITGFRFVSPRPSRRLTIGSRSNPPTCSLHPLSFICGTLGLLGGAACCCLVLLCPPMRIQTQHKHTRIYTYVD